MTSRTHIFSEIDAERDRQDGKMGRTFDGRNTANDWVSYITRYAGKACASAASQVEFERQMVFVASLAVAAIETSRRNGGPAARHYDRTGV